MKNRELKFVEGWGRTRENGRIRFALKTGIIWSIITAFFSKIFKLSELSFSEVYYNDSFLKFLAFFIIIGTMIFWKFIWEQNEKKYKRLLTERENESNSK